MYTRICVQCTVHRHSYSFDINTIYNNIHCYILYICIASSTICTYKMNKQKKRLDERGSSVYSFLCIANIIDIIFEDRQR